MIAKNCGARYCAALIHNPDLASDMDYFQNLASIDYILTPQKAAAEKIQMQIGLPGKLEAASFFGNNAIMLKATVDKDGVLDHKSMAELKNYFCDKILIGTVYRDNKIFIPNGKFTLKSGDEIEIIADNKDITNVLEKLGIPHNTAEKILLMGCGTTGYYLVQQLLGKKNL